MLSVEFEGFGIRLYTIGWRPGNLTNSVATDAAKARLNCYIFIPDGLKQGATLENLDPLY